MLGSGSRFVMFAYLIIRLAENSSKVISIPIRQLFQLLVAGEVVKREVRIVVLRMCAVPFVQTAANVDVACRW